MEMNIIINNILMWMPEYDAWVSWEEGKKESAETGS